MLRILFWNLQRKDLRPLVSSAAKAVSADIIILLESAVALSDMLAELKANVSADYYHPSVVVRRFQIFAKDTSLDLSEDYGTNRLSLRRLMYEGHELLLGAVHVVDKSNFAPMQQSHEVHMLAADISRREGALGHDRTILIGDFNMNPFDEAMNVATGMNAMMTTNCVERGFRLVQESQKRGQRRS